jgi:DNA polymerase III alpha subunit
MFAYMIPLFKSHFSIGKSILKLQSNTESDGADGIFNIAQEECIEKLFLIEDSLTGFLESAKTSKDLGIQLVFGLRITACDSYSVDKKPNDCHKLVIFSKNDEGCKLLNKIYSCAFRNGNDSIQMEDLAKLWDEKSLKLVIPFYDSFIYNNVMTFSKCAPLFNFTDPTFFIENNELPFDQIIKDNILKFCKKRALNTAAAKTIYYKNRDDFEAFQTYKCICSRGGWAGRSTSLQKPNLDHCGSKEFCIESWREQK